MIRKISTLLLTAALGLALSAHADLTSSAEVCLDNNVTGDMLTQQYERYAEARDAVVKFQQGEEDRTPDQVISLVREESLTAVKSWVRAACACYLGALEAQAGDVDKSREAYKAAEYWARLAIKFDNDTDAKVEESQTQGAKYLAIARKNLRH